MKKTSYNKVDMWINIKDGPSLRYEVDVYMNEDPAKLLPATAESISRIGFLQVEDNSRTYWPPSSIYSINWDLDSPVAVVLQPIPVPIIGSGGVVLEDMIH